MCGRFTLRAPASVVAEQFAVFGAPPFAPRFNIAPSQPVAVVRLAPGCHWLLASQCPDVMDRNPACTGRQAASGTRRQLVHLRWGLIPGWAKDPAVGNRMINARAETVAQKPAFRAALRRRRCLLPADGFYEWRGSGKRKQPYFIRMRDDGLFAFAGLWESWQAAGQTAIESCTLLTTEPNDLLRPIHNRMPVILAPQSYGQWLDPGVEQVEQLAPLLVPYPSQQMTAHPVDTLVNNPANEDPRCIAPVGELFS